MTKTFKEAYGVLNRHAQTLRNQQDPNIDELLGIVTESVDAYKICKQRIDAVEAALQEALADPAVVSSAAGPAGDAPPAPAAARPSARPAGSSAAADSDDDVPF
jgi:exodeoxyribonuclease VII small subunit